MVGADHTGRAGLNSFLLAAGTQVEVVLQQLSQQFPPPGLEEFFQAMVGKPAGCRGAELGHERGEEIRRGCKRVSRR
jgi:hypothetical protein